MISGQMLQNEELAIFPVWTNQHKKKSAITREYSMAAFASAGRFEQFILKFEQFVLKSQKISFPQAGRINKLDNISISFCKIRGVKW